MKRTLILLGIFAGLLLLVSCKKEVKEEEKWVVEGIYMKTAGTDMIYIENEGPCLMENLSEEQKQMLAEHKTGDRISVEIDIIQETYPGHCYPKEVAFLEEGDVSSLNVEELMNLRNMGYLVITDDHPDGLPKFEFSLTWGVYGISSYDSVSGKLVKTKDATHPEEYVTTHMLTTEERTKVWQSLMSMSYESLPKDYDPCEGLKSEPSETILLHVEVEGKTYDVQCKNIALMTQDELKNVSSNAGRDFFRGIWQICSLLQQTEEWQALPEYEFLYD
ncbi:MAG: hypothetical protein IJ744_05455 [Lachnospiraceae bacterium]|nr:hypothetical protein [Lachnospiraceae bacterium]